MCSIDSSAQCAQSREDRSKACKVRVKDIITILQKTPEDEYERAIQELRIEDSLLEKAVLEALGDESRTCWRRAALIAGKRRYQSAVERLVEILDPKMYEKANNTLGPPIPCDFELLINPGRTNIRVPVDILRELDKPLRTVAYKSLHKITGNDFGEDYHLWKQWLESTTEWK
jgi:hypothetical protein